MDDSPTIQIHQYAPPAETPMLYTVAMRGLRRDELEKHLKEIGAVEAWIWDATDEGITMRVLSYVKESK